MTVGEPNSKAECASGLQRQLSIPRRCAMGRLGVHILQLEGSFLLSPLWTLPKRVACKYSIPGLPHESLGISSPSWVGKITVGQRGVWR